MSLKTFILRILLLFSSLTLLLIGGIIYLLYLLERPAWMLAVSLAFVAALMAGLAWLGAELISRKYTAQLLLLKQTMKEVADGNLGVQCSVHMDNEIGDLVKSFNKMLLIMKSSQDDLNFMREMLKGNEEIMRSSYHQIEYLAYHDALTQLPNKLAFYEKVEKLLSSSREEKLQHGLLFIDLDNFKQINDTYGHEYGDSILQQASERLLRIIDSERDLIARIGGDEFLIFAYDIGREERLQSWKTKIKEVFEHPFLLREEELWLTMSVGCAVFPDHGTTQQCLVKNADIAMYRAKQAGKNQFCVFDKTMEPLEE